MARPRSLGNPLLCNMELSLSLEYYMCRLNDGTLPAAERNAAAVAALPLVHEECAVERRVTGAGNVPPRLR
jgi:hypothetical protein